MILFLVTITAVTALFGGLAFFAGRKMSSRYRGALFILLSGLYFTVIFAIAHEMRERFL